MPPPPATCRPSVIVKADGPEEALCLTGKRSSTQKKEGKPERASSSCLHVSRYDSCRRIIIGGQTKSQKNRASPLIPHPSPLLVGCSHHADVAAVACTACTRPRSKTSLTCGGRTCLFQAPLMARTQYPTRSNTKKGFSFLLL